MCDAGSAINGAWSHSVTCLIRSFVIMYRLFSYLALNKAERNCVCITPFFKAYITAFTWRD
jgi:hypothetical protein